MSSPTAEAEAATSQESAIELALTLDEARMLHSVAQRGLLAAGADGGPNGQPQHASSAIEKLSAELEQADTVAAVRDELGQAGFDTRRLSDAQVYGLAQRLADIPKRPSH